MLITLFNAPENRFRMSQLAETAVLTPSGLDLLGSLWRDLGLVCEPGAPPVSQIAANQRRPWGTNLP